MNNIYCKRPRGPQKRGPLAIATFATTVNPALGDADVALYLSRTLLALREGVPVPR